MFRGSTVTPAATGQLQAELDDNGNSWVELELAHPVPFHHFRLLVSAEDLPWPERPRDPIVMQTEYVEAR